MHLVDFSLMSQQASGVGEAGVKLASRLAAFVGPLVSIHVPVPFADPLKYREFAAIVDVIAEHLSIFVARRRSGASECPCDAVGMVICCGRIDRVGHDVRSLRLWRRNAQSPVAIAKRRHWIGMLHAHIDRWYDELEMSCGMRVGTIYANSMARGICLLVQVYEYKLGMGVWRLQGCAP
jgi:hypothetical protein